MSKIDGYNVLNILWKHHCLILNAKKWEKGKIYGEFKIHDISVKQKVTLFKQYFKQGLTYYAQEYV